VVTNIATTAPELKHETRNPKQYRKPKYETEGSLNNTKCSKQNPEFPDDAVLDFGNSNFVFV